MVLYPAWNLDILSCGCAGIKVIAEMIIQAIESLLSRMLVQFHVYESSSVLSVYKFPPKLNDSGMEKLHFLSIFGRRVTKNGEFCYLGF